MTTNSDDRLQHELAIAALLYRMARRSETYRLLHIARARELSRGAKRH